MKKKLVIMVGDYGSGKTSFGKYLAKINNGCPLSHDDLRYHPPVDFNRFIYRLDAYITKTKYNYYTLDGWAEYPPCYERLAGLGFEVEICLCFAAPHIIQERQSKKNLLAINETLPKTYVETIESTLAIVKELRDLPFPVFYADTTGYQDTDVMMDYQEFIDRYRARQIESRLAGRTHDKYYQDIELPTLRIGGYSNSRETWRRIRSIVDFTDKTVLDIGCFHGYFLFQAERHGAKKMTGVDANGQAIQTAKEIGMVLQSKARFKQVKIEDYEIPDDIYDITLCLNMLHHTDDINKALENIMLTGEHLIFEINNDQAGIVSKYAADRGIVQTQLLNSHRLGRRIVHYQNPELTEIHGNIFTVRPTPERYRYNPRREKLKELFYKTYQAAKKLPVIGILVSYAVKILYIPYVRKVKNAS